MLREIAIKNFAIIDDLRASFEKGLNIISGETGAGKSVIINALSILLGSRADSSMIRTGAEKAELEALFDIDPSGPAASILEEQGYEAAEELLIRRILSRSDRHRVYINGRLATMQLLSRLTGYLAGISGQHEHQRLLRESEHLAMMDQFAGLGELRNEVSGCLREIRPLIRNLEKLRENRCQQSERTDLLRFQKHEIESAGLVPGEEEDIRHSLKRLKNAEFLYRTAGAAAEELYDGEDSVTDRLRAVLKEIAKASDTDQDLAGAADSLEDAAIRIEDTAVHLRGYADGIEFDPARIDEYEARLDTINRLKRKYGASVEEILEYLGGIDSELLEMENIDGSIGKAEKELEKASARLGALAEDLSRKRQEAAEDLAARMERELASLKMEGTRFSVSLQENRPGPDTPEWLCTGGKAVSESGAEQAVFMIAPNPGEDPRPLSRIASGGELSRIILALKAILSETEAVETVIFDEVDSGIGGEVAEVVGRKLALLSGAGQVICITHLAQIARFGDHHFRITKQVRRGRTATSIERLDESARVEETARMMGGEAITETTRAHAEELLKDTGQGGSAKG